MKETKVQIDGMISIVGDAGVEKEIKRRDGAVRGDASFLNRTATIAYDETHVRRMISMDMTPNSATTVAARFWVGKPLRRRDENERY